MPEYPFVNNRNSLTSIAFSRNDIETDKWLELRKKKTCLPKFSNRAYNIVWKVPICYVMTAHYIADGNTKNFFPMETHIKVMVFVLERLWKTEEHCSNLKQCPLLEFDDYYNDFQLSWMIRWKELRKNKIFQKRSVMRKLANISNYIICLLLQSFYPVV